VSKNVVAEQMGMGTQTPFIKTKPPLQVVQTALAVEVQVACAQSVDRVQGTQMLLTESKKDPSLQVGIATQTPLIKVKPELQVMQIEAAAPTQVALAQFPGLVQPTQTLRVVSKKVPATQTGTA
jgi:hypothetical protein